MTKKLKIYSAVLLGIFCFSFFISIDWVFSASTDPGVACDICESSGDSNNHTSCAQGLQCIEKQCQDPNKITFCPISSHKDYKDLVKEISKWMTISLLVLVPLVVLLGGFYMLTAADDKSRFAKGRTIIVWAVIGLAIVLFAKAFISIITSFIF